jgi:hypothetical protein
MIMQYFKYAGYVEIAAHVLSQYIICFIYVHMSSSDIDTEKVEGKLVSHNTC